MINIKGTKVNDFIAVGRAKVIKAVDEASFVKKADDPAVELERYHRATKAAKEELKKLHDKTYKTVGPDEAQIFEVHQMMLEDEEFTEMIESEINDNGTSAEYGVAVARDNFAGMLAALDDEYMSQRANDVKDIASRIINCLSNSASTDAGESKDNIPVIVCADDLLPSQIVSMDLDTVTGVALAKGSPSSHASILANSFGLASVVSAGEVFTSAITDGQFIVIDGKENTIILDPDKEILDDYVARYREQLDRMTHLKDLVGKPAISIDGTKVELAANVGGPKDIASAKENDADFIGLFRTEFMYLECDDYPSEEKQFEVYKKMAQDMEGRRVVCRTLDIGSDKSAPYFNLDDEENPALGLRAIRLCFSREGLLETQLRALYRASVYGKIAIMFPMIANVWEVERLLETCENVRTQLKIEGIEFDENVEHGIMIETPAAALIADKLAPLVDFFSVGTNDLIQYTLACDRTNSNLNPFCNTHHEAVIELIERAAWFAHQNDA